jgi:hypothetical protein
MFRGNVLNCMRGAPYIISIALTAIENILKVGGFTEFSLCMDSLKALNCHNSLYT